MDQEHLVDNLTADILSINRPIRQQVINLSCYTPSSAAVGCAGATFDNLTNADQELCRFVAEGLEL